MSIGMKLARIQGISVFIMLPGLRLKGANLQKDILSKHEIRIQLKLINPREKKCT